MDDFIDQALRQMNAARQRPIRWYFSEKEAADFVRVRFILTPTFGTELISLNSSLSQEDDNETHNAFCIPSG